MKTRREFIEEHRHEFGGFVLDASHSRDSGAELSIRLRAILRKIDERIGVMYDQLAEKTNGHANGHAGAALPKALGKG